MTTWTADADSSRPVGPISDFQGPGVPLPTPPVPEALNRPTARRCKFWRIGGGVVQAMIVVMAVALCLLYLLSRAL